jgi:hypothetical protein
VFKWLYVALILVIVAAGFSLLRFTYEPAPVPVMAPSYFDTPTQIGEVLLKRFYSPVSTDKIVFFGVPPKPDWHRQVVQGFLLAAAREKVPFDVVLAEEQMPELDLKDLPGMDVQKVIMNEQTSAFVTQLQGLRSSGKRVLVYTASVFSTHLVAGNAIAKYENVSGLHVLALTSGPLALRSDQEQLVDPPCVGSEVDREGFAPLGCAFLKGGRGFYRKHLLQDRYVAIMNSTMPDDFLLMISAPGQAGAPTPSPDSGTH